MDNFETGRLLYLVLLGGALAVYFFAANRHRLADVARQALLWGLIFIGVIAAVGLWSDIRTDILPRQAVFDDGARVEVPRSADGHYHLRLRLNGTPVDFIVDTGASSVVLRKEDAVRIGINPDDLIYSGIARTANGQVMTARVQIDEIALGPIVDRNMTVAVNEGEMPGSLLGMAYLQRFNRLEISNGTLILER